MTIDVGAIQERCEKCPRCGGAGEYEWGGGVCEKCQGSGVIAVSPASTPRSPNHD